MAFEVHLFKTCRHIAIAAGAEEFDASGRRRMRATVHTHLGKRGMDYAFKEAKLTAQKIKKQQEKQKKTNDRLVNLEKQIGALSKQVDLAKENSEKASEKFAAELEAKNAEAAQHKGDRKQFQAWIKQLVKMIQHIGALAATAAISRSRAEVAAPRESIKVLLDGVVRLLGGEGKVRASWWLFKNGVGRVGPISPNQLPKDKFDRSHVTRDSFEGASLNGQGDYRWPDESELFGDRRAIKGYDPRRDAWPRRWYIPIPFLLDRHATQGAPEGYAVIRVDYRKGFRPPEHCEEAAAAVVALADIFVKLPEEAANAGINEERKAADR